jgi:hypothetical protein
MEYKVLTAISAFVEDGSDRLSVMVNEALAIGWKPIGGVASCIDSTVAGGQVHVSQAVIRD